MPLTCPNCRATIGRRAVRPHFACARCRTALNSNYWPYFGVVLALAFAAHIVVMLVLGLGFDVPGRTAKNIGAGILVFATLLAFLFMPRFIKLNLAPLRQSGLPPADVRGEAGSGESRQLSALEQQRWREGVTRFERVAWLGALLGLAGLVGGTLALFLMLKSPISGLLGMATGFAAAFAGCIMNIRLARRFLRCPQCDRYPRGGAFLSSHYPFMSVYEFRDACCVHCGCALPLEK